MSCHHYLTLVLYFEHQQGSCSAVFPDWKNKLVMILCDVLQEFVSFLFMSPHVWLDTCLWSTILPQCLNCKRAIVHSHINKTYKCQCIFTPGDSEDNVFLEYCPPPLPPALSLPLSLWCCVLMQGGLSSLSILHMTVDLGLRAGVLPPPHEENSSQRLRWTGMENRWPFLAWWFRGYHRKVVESYPAPLLCSFSQWQCVFSPVSVHSPTTWTSIFWFSHSISLV